ERHRALLRQPRPDARPGGLWPDPGKARPAHLRQLRPAHRPRRSLLPAPQWTQALSARYALCLLRVFTLSAHPARHVSTLESCPSISPRLSTLSAHAIKLCLPSKCRAKGLPAGLTTRHVSEQRACHQPVLPPKCRAIPWESALLGMGLPASPATDH